VSHEPLDAVLDRGAAVLRELDGIRSLTYPALNELAGIRAITTLRGAGGSGQGDPAESFLADMTPWVEKALGVPGARFAAGRQVHGDEHVVITGDNVPGPGELRRFEHTDALMTALPGVALVVLTADCLPIFLADATARAVCMLHAGKVGTRKQIASQAAHAFLEKLGARAEKTVALIGPSIGDGCYPFRLWEENARQLREAGIGRVVNARLCTACNLAHFYSYRAEKGFTGRMLSAIIVADA
jgi:copper oxidase (laccase) domain-containing protein